MRVRLVIEYDGTNYAGWQRQTNALAVQQVIEDALSKLTGVQTIIAGAGRTDSGVHALGQVAHFDTASSVPADKFAFALNTMLPKDIRICGSERVADDFHARFSAKGKRYRYWMYSAPHAGAINRNTHAHVVYPLDIDAMRKEISALVGTHDFAAFAASGSVVKDTTRTIWRADVEKREAEYELTVEGDGFLYNMVRIIAGTMISVGAGKVEPGAIARAIRSGNRLDLGATAPAHGLTLMRVFYEGDHF